MKVEKDRLVFLRETGRSGETATAEPVISVDFFRCDRKKRCRVSPNCVINGGPCSMTTEKAHDADRD